MKKMTALIGLAILFTGCIGDIVQTKTDYAIVTGKEFIRGEEINKSDDLDDSQLYFPYSLLCIGQSNVALYVKHREPDKYLVRLEYDKAETILDNKELYDKVEVGSAVKVQYIRYYDFSKRLYKKELKLVEDK